MLLVLGGTIAMRATAGGSVVPGLRASDLLASIGMDDNHVRLESRTVKSIASANILVADLQTVIAAIEAAANDGFDGCVIVQGTDTLEESAWALELLAPRGLAVVLTGAMRNPTLPGADGPANLLAAIQVAAHPGAKDLGALVVMNDQIHSSRFVVKAHTFSTAAFASPDCGPLGWIIEGRPRFLAALPPALRLPPLRDEPKRVALLTTWLGDDGALLRTAAGADLDGIVIEGFGAGHLPEVIAPIAGALAERMPVVLASACHSGEVAHATYGFVGGEQDLIGRGLIPAGPINGRKARLLLALALQSGASADEIRSLFGRLSR